MKHNHYIAMACLAVVLTMTLLGGCGGPDQRSQSEQQPVKPKVQSHVRSPDPRIPPSPTPVPPSSGKAPRTDARPQQLGRIHPNNGLSAQGVEQQRNAINEPTRELRSDPSPPKIPDEVRGIYVSGWVAGGTKAMGKLTRLVEQTDLNAMVIDVKNDFGQVTYASQLSEVSRLGADATPAIKDLPALLKRLKAKGIYTIGRVVVFKDPHLARKKPEWAIRTKTGALWQDRKGVPWVDPYHPEVRAYNIAIAEEAARLGFQEIQFDYVRFPDNAEEMDKVVKYHNAEGKAKEDVIGGFLRDAKPVLNQAGAAVSADVFGLVTSSRDDMGIGQTWRQVAPAVDVVSPMTYPSHYSSGMYGIEHPDLQPGKVISHAMKDAVYRNRILKDEGLKPGIVRPWLQAFTATWVHPHQEYRAGEIEQQVRAAKRAGVRQFLLWSSNCKYPYRS
jgi:hypothetical protein